ncbi:hypothetical protein GCM10010317_077430 [Streptomyces mirabilis]|uniref:hypothetical protein n=1 Tax=Streptomyces mirabilis TaxID=68239 RepID=UPI00167C54C8|nr:hypothetical protein [Streptomyces mirabilis]GHD70331.1 hypothetical protein GCM10010317_077430 [Streptomyces mirabilis]
MATLLPTPVQSPASSVTPTRLLDAPLPQLLDELDVLLMDTSITDRGFFGAVVQRKSGELLLAMPAGRSELEHDTVARYLLAQVFDVDLPQLPAPFVTSEICSPAPREQT